MEKIKIQIKSKYTGSILFEYEQENNTLKDTIEKAIKNRADLAEANLRGADLTGANLIGANLTDADLAGANLRGANLRGADLGDANLTDADLTGAYLRCADFRCANLAEANLAGADLGSANLLCANLRGADLGSANLAGANLRGADLADANLGDFGKLQDICTIWPIGSRKSHTACYKTDKGIFIQCGCFKGSLDEFVTKVKATHQGNTHERDYLAMVEFIKIKFQ